MLSTSHEIERVRDVLIATPGAPHPDVLDILELVGELRESVRSDACRTVLLDLSEVDYFSSACLGELVSLARDIEPMRSQVALAGCTDVLREMLELTRLCTLFDCHDTMDSAREELGLDA